MFAFERSIERLAFDHEVPPPPPEIKQRQENFTRSSPVVRYRREQIPPGGGNGNNQSHPIPVYERSPYITVHKNWRSWFLFSVLPVRSRLG
ncbi:hypothetical protein [Paraflavitalea speifideaquila]|uniref:hypothetical protein n=1 Tax=Paraflavitalea speifideaquila TaxID=3076558 RepID=UPI0028E82C03|nr:hypothetical protein [Paraflavitalea speifideiaquila]